MGKFKSRKAECGAVPHEKTEALRWPQGLCQQAYHCGIPSNRGSCWTNGEKPDLEKFLPYPLSKGKSLHPLLKGKGPMSFTNQKKLKVSTSDVSVGSHGLPKMFGTPEPSAAASPASSKPLPKGEPHEESPLPKGEPSEPNSLPKGKTLAKAIAEPSFLRRRLGQLATKTRLRRG